MKFLDIDLYTADPEGTRHFYTKQLGLDILDESTDQLTLQIGWTRLTFRAVPSPVAPYHFAINVPASTLEVCMHCYPFDYLDTQATGKVIAEFPAWGARACYFYDNNGNLLEFIGRNSLPLDNPNLTIGDLFQGISELGMGTENVPLATRQLRNQFGVPQFNRSTPMSDFNAVGDDNGLFIFSQVGRNWLFTNTPAALNYCRVTFETEPNGALQTLCSYDINQTPVGYAYNYPC